MLVLCQCQSFDFRISKARKTGSGLLCASKLFARPVDLFEKEQIKTCAMWRSVYIWIVSMELKGLFNWTFLEISLKDETLVTPTCGVPYTFKLAVKSPANWSPWTFLKSWYVTYMYKTGQLVAPRIHLNWLQGRNSTTDVSLPLPAKCSSWEALLLITWKTLSNKMGKVNSTNNYKFAKYEFLKPRPD